MIRTKRSKKKKVLEATPEGAKRAAISLLAHREQTEKELLSKLIERGFSREDALEAVEFAKEKQYLSEQRYFFRFVEFYGKNKQFGRRRILQEAKRKGFSEEVVELYAKDALMQVDFDSGCFEALKKMKPSGKEKLTAALLRRGYSMYNVRYAFERYEEEIGSLEGSAADFEEEFFDDGDET